MEKKKLKISNVYEDLLEVSYKTKIISKRIRALESKLKIKRVKTEVSDYSQEESKVEKEKEERKKEIERKKRQEEEEKRRQEEEEKRRQEEEEKRRQEEEENQRQEEEENQRQEEEEKRRQEEEEKQRQKQLKDAFKDETAGLGDTDFINSKNESNEKNLHNILPKFVIYFELEEREAKKYLKEKGIDEFKDRISKIIPKRDFNITNLRIGSIELEVTPLVDKCREYIHKLAKCKKEEVDAIVKEFKKYFEELGKKLGDLRYDLFNSKIDLAKSVKIINLDKTPDQIREIKKYAGLTDEEAKKEFLGDKAKEITNHLGNSGVQKNEKDGSGLKDLEKEIQSNVDKKLDTLMEAIRNESKEREEIVIKNLKDIEKAMDNMVSAGKYSEEFYKELEIAKKDSIFDYVVQSIPITYKDSSKYEKKKENCPNCQTQILFHGTLDEYAGSIITTEFSINKNSLGKLGCGAYFSDMLDHTRFYSLCRINEVKVPKIGETFNVVASEVFFDKTKIKKITNSFIDSNEEKNEIKDTLAEENGMNYGLGIGVGTVYLVGDGEIEKYKNYYLGREYMVSCSDQINPIYGIKLKRAEYCIIWRDPNFGEKNEFTEYILDLKKYIEKNIGYNLYIEETTESAIKLVKKKKYNKIILISNIGQDLGGKDFVEKAREILGQNVFAFFSSYDEGHMDEEWFRNCPNVLFGNKKELFKEFLTNFNEEGLTKFKEKVETTYGRKFMDFQDVFNYKNFKDTGEIDELDCTDFELYRHKFLPN